MTKPELAILEKCFVAEINDHLPYQQRMSKPLQKLLDDGMIQPMKRVFPGRFAVTCEGYQLTHLGRITYCTSCDEPTK